MIIINGLMDNTSEIMNEYWLIVYNLNLIFYKVFIYFLVIFFKNKAFTVIIFSF